MASTVPSNILFLGITLPTTEDVFIATSLADKQFQKLWVINYNTQHCWCTNYGSPSLIEPDEACDVYPKLKIRIHGQFFKPGNMFVLKDIRFVIINEECAVALDSIMKLSLSDLPEKDAFSNTCYFPNSYLSKRLKNWM